jgi:hypothetical protein
VAEDGKVTSIHPTDHGGSYVVVNGKNYYVAPEQDPTVAVGDRVEAGDALSNGLPNPAAIVSHKGVGEGRRYFMNLMRDVFKESGISTSRRNIEIMSRAIINHVEVDDASESLPGALPGDVIEYDRLAYDYRPRSDAKDIAAKQAVGQYLERPVLHFSIGTRITPNVLKLLKRHDVGKVLVHKDPPPFSPYMQRTMTNMLNTPDWLDRLGSFYVQRGLLDAVSRGATSDLKSLSYIPALITGKELPGERLRK